MKPPSRKLFLEKSTEKSETVINTCVSIIKQQWKKMAEIPQECDFLTWSIQNFVKKVNSLLENIILINHMIGCFQHGTVNGCYFAIVCCFLIVAL